MKTWKRLLCLMLVVLTLGCLCACDDGSDDEGSEQSPEQQVRACVENRGNFEYYGRKIGGNEIKSSKATITNLKKITDTKYEVSGQMVMTDVYGNTYRNTFDCEVNKYTDDWMCSSFDYTSSNWSK